MDDQDYSPPRMEDSSRPSIGFPLGTALLLIVLFSLSGVFSCCYHWDKLKSLRRQRQPLDPEGDYDYDRSTPSKAKDDYKNSKQKEWQSLTVLMPGDVVPKFIALPSPCEPPRPSKSIIVHVDKPAKSPIIAIPMYT